MIDGAIWIHRQLLESSVFSNEKKLKIWIWMLLKASYKDRYVSIQIGRGLSEVLVKRGSFIFGRYKAEEALCLDGSTIYKIIHWMETENMIKIESNSHYSIISICNYDSYQDIKQNIEQPSNNRVTTDEQPSNNRVTTEEHIQESNNKVKESNNKVNSSSEQKEKTQIEIENENRYKNFMKWIDEYCPSINKMKEPFTQPQFEQIIFDKKLNPSDKNDLGLLILRNMHNKADLTKKYKSAYLTFLSWYKMAKKQ